MHTCARTDIEASTHMVSSIRTLDPPPCSPPKLKAKAMPALLVPLGAGFCSHGTCSQKTCMSMRMRIYMYMRAGTVCECISRSHSCGAGSSSPPKLQDVTVCVCKDNMHLHAHVYVHDGGHTEVMHRIGHGMEATRSLLLMSWGCLRAVFCRDWLL